MEIVNLREYSLFTKEILLEMPFMRKVSITKQIIEIPKNILSNINKINDIRNAITHTLTPEQLKNKRVLYNKKNIYEINTIVEFNKDYKKTSDFLQKLFEDGFEKDIYIKH